jgi:adenine phosphoribosyltransferase
MTAIKHLGLDELRAQIRDVPDFPKPGIVFKDLTPLLADGAALRSTQALLAERIAPFHPDVIVGIESRGFIFGAMAATALGIGLVPVRKPGKLPWRKRRIEYDLEYGQDALEIHEDALQPKQRVVIVDDLLATGGTAAATARLCTMHGAEVACAAFVIELGFLDGRNKVAPLPVDALLTFR